MANNEENSLPLIGRDIPFKAVNQEVCHVIRFAQLSTVKNGVVRAFQPNMPYGFLEVESTAFTGTAMLTIAHKDDFLHVWQAMEERGLADDEELLVVWTNDSYKNGVFKLLSKAMPKLVVLVCRKDAYKLISDKSFRPNLKGYERYDAQKPVFEIRPSVMQ